MKLRSAFVVSFVIGFAVLAAAAPDTPEALIEAGHWKRARAIIEARVKANPNDAQAQRMLSQIKRAFGDLDGALAPAEKAVSLDNNCAPCHLLLADTLGQMAGKASFFKQISLGRRFKKELDTALSLDPNNFGVLEEKVGFLWNAPGVFGGDKKQAREVANRAEQINPERGALLQANLAAEEKDTARQEQYLLKAVQANPKSYAALTSLGNYYANQKKYDLAEKYARQALAIDATRVRAYTLLSWLYVTQLRLSDLDAILAAADKNVPDNLTPHYTAGNVLLSQGKELARAEAEFRKYLSQEAEGFSVNHSFAHWRLGLVLEKLGRKPEALAEVQAAARMNPNNDAIKKDLSRLKG